MLTHVLVIHASYRLYTSNENEKYDCLYHTRRQYNNNKERRGMLPLSPYCMEKFNIQRTCLGVPFTFNQLLDNHYTSQHLFQWQAPFDLIDAFERFQETAQLEDQSKWIFCNCSHPFFGRYCELIFVNRMPNINELAESYKTHFDFVVIEQFYMKSRFLITEDYEFQDECIASLRCKTISQSWCLDWREICDGKYEDHVKPTKSLKKRPTSLILLEKCFPEFINKTDF